MNMGHLSFLFTSSFVDAVGFCAAVTSCCPPFPPTAPASPHTPIPQSSHAASGPESLPWAPAILRGPSSVLGTKCFSGQSLFTPLSGAPTALPALGASSCPRRFSSCPPHPGALFFICLGHLSPSERATSRLWLPEARVSLPSHPLCPLRLGTGRGNPRKVCRSNETVSGTRSPQHHPSSEWRYRP